MARDSRRVETVFVGIVRGLFSLANASSCWYLSDEAASLRWFSCCPSELTESHGNPVHVFDVYFR